MINAPHLILTATLLLAAFLTGASLGALLKSIALAITAPRAARKASEAGDAAQTVLAAIAVPSTPVPEVQPLAATPTEPAIAEAPVVEIVPDLFATGPESIDLGPHLLAEAVAPVPTVADEAPAELASSDSPVEPQTTPPPTADAPSEPEKAAAPAGPVESLPTEPAAAVAESAVPDTPPPPTPRPPPKTVSRDAVRDIERVAPGPRGFAETMLAMTRGSVPSISTMPPLPPLPTFEQHQIQRRYAGVSPSRKAGQTVAGMAIPDPRSRPPEPAAAPRVTVVPMAEVIPFPLTPSQSAGQGGDRSGPRVVPGPYPASIAPAIIEDIEPAIAAPAIVRTPTAIAVPFETELRAPVAEAKTPVPPLAPEPVAAVEPPPAPSLPEPASLPVAAIEAAPAPMAAPIVELAPVIEPTPVTPPPVAVAEPVPVPPVAPPAPAQTRAPAHTEPGTGLPLGLESTLAEAIGATMELAPPGTFEPVAPRTPRPPRREAQPAALAAFDIVADDAPPEDAFDDLDIVPEFELVGFDLTPPAPEPEAPGAEPTLEAPIESSEEPTIAPLSAEEQALVADLGDVPAAATLDDLASAGPEPIDLERMRAALADEPEGVAVGGQVVPEVSSDPFVAGIAQALLGGTNPSPAAEGAAMRAIEGAVSPRRAPPRLVALTLDDGDDPALSAVAASGAAVASASRTANAIVADLKLDPDRPAGLSAPRDGKPDDLTHIIGVLPVIETALNRLGIYHFDQISDWSSENVGWVEAYLGLEGRVSRELWRLQARELAAARPSLRSAKK